MKQSQLVFSEKLPSPKILGEELFLIYDKILEKKSPALRQWIAKFPVLYGVASGEELKALENLPAHLHKIMQLTKNMSSRRMTMVVLGGGSLGDFGGFVASIYKRGVRLVHIPSTWLAAIDSAHGGKTALNVQKVKNQIGTFYPAEKVILVRDLLQTQPEIRAHEAFSEIYKAALLSGGKFWQDFSKVSPNGKSLWQFLPKAIEAKYRIVRKDPLEISGHRHLLNFGHTMGHVLESLFELPHGIAVNYGIEFALQWGRDRGVTSEKSFQALMAAPASSYLLSSSQDGFLAKKYSARIVDLLMADKKKVGGGKIRFIFCARPGVFKIEEVSAVEILHEVQRQALA